MLSSSWTNLQDLQRVLSTLKVKKKAVEELTAPGTIRESSLYKPLAQTPHEDTQGNLLFIG